MRDIDTVIAAGPYAADWPSLERYTVPDWYADAKFGIFIHWGVYAVPAYKNEWYPRIMYQRGNPAFEHHRTTWGDQKTFGYKDFIPQFRAENWDPAAWADLFRRAGAKYVVPVAEHHDGFPMYDSDQTDWTAVKRGPKRDIVGELAAATRAEGLRFGASSHRAFNWRYYTFDDDFDTVDPANVGLYGRPHPKEQEEADEPFLVDWLRRCCEIVDKYRPDLVWFDFGFNRPEFEPYRQRFGAYYYNRAAQWGREVVINYKEEAFPAAAAVLDIERGKLDAIRPRLWQTDTSVCKVSWGYIDGHQFRTVDSLVDDLVDIVAKNGVLLLNVGPRPDGTLPEEEVALLEGIGEWLSVNGEAIYGTRPWTVFGEGPTRIKTGTFAERDESGFTPQDIRYTAKGDTLYAILLGWPGERVTLQSLSTHLRLYPGEIGAVTMLGHDGPLQTTRDERGLHVELPAKAPGSHAFTLKIVRTGDEAKGKTAEEYLGTPT